MEGCSSATNSSFGNSPNFVASKALNKRFDGVAIAPMRSANNTNLPYNQSKIMDIEEWSKLPERLHPLFNRRVNFRDPQVKVCD